MPCLPDGFQLCRTICQALPRPRSFHIGLAGPPSGRRPIRDINTTTDPTNSLSLFRPLWRLCPFSVQCVPRVMFPVFRGQAAVRRPTVISGLRLTI